MTFRIPSREEIQHFARTMGFTLSEAETKAYAALIPGVFSLLNQLEQLPDPSPAYAFPTRQPGSRPDPENDPLNAIVQRCSVVGSPSGPLAGKRIGLKDNISVAGMPMTCGSTVLQGFTPDTDATIVTRLLEARAEIVAILNMDNFAFSGEGNTSAYGPTLNPHNPKHLAGGSSGGSAAALYYDDIDVTIGGIKLAQFVFPLHGVVSWGSSRRIASRPIPGLLGSTRPLITLARWPSPYRRLD